MSDVNISKFRAQVVRDGSKPATPGFVVSEGQSPTDPAGSGQNHLPVTIAPAATALSITESQILGGSGTVGQYIRGDGSLADFPAATGGGSSVSYYLNGSVSQGTIGGVAYKELNRTPIFGAGTDISINANGYIASFITDAGDPNKLLIPAGNWNFETYFSASSGGGSPTFYVELYKYDGTTFTLIATSSGTPELIAFGTNINPYFSTLAVPQTVLTLTDRLALRYYVNTSGRTITLHTENGHLCQVITTFTTGLTALNGLTSQVQFFAVGTSGTDFNIASATATHTFNLPTASGTNRGALSSTDWTTFNNKENAITAGTTAQYFRGDKTFQTLNTSVVPEGTNLYYTEARVNANTNVAANTAARHNAVTLGTANGLSLSTQVLSLGLASAGVTGALSGTDWNTFNSKQNALTNPVTGTGTTNYLPKFTGASTIGDSVIADNATEINIPKRIFLNSGGQSIFFTPNLSSASNRIEGSSGVPLEIFTSGSALRFAAGGVSTQFTLASSGAATFASSVTANGTLIANTGTGATLRAIFSTTNQIEVGNYNATDGYRELALTGSLLTLYTGTAGGGSVSERARITSGGNLLVGTTTDAGQRLQVSGQGTFTDSANGFNIDLVKTAGFGALIQLKNTSASSNELIRIVNSSNTIISQIYPATNGIGITTGNLGVGTSSPSRKLTVSNASNGDIALFTNTSDADLLINLTSGVTLLTPTTGILAFGTSSTERMRITSSGNVGIGTTSPLSKLEVVNSAGSQLLIGYNAAADNYYDAANHFFRSASGASNRVFISGISGNVGIGTTSPTVLLQLNTADTVNNIFRITNGTQILNFGVNNSSGGSFIFESAAQALRFGTSDTERMRITSGGNVGIGTSSPSFKLDVQNNTQAVTRILDTSTNSSLILQAGTGSAMKVTAYNYNTSTAIPLYIQVDGANTIMQSGGGNVLIGTTTDNGAKLNVNGTIRSNDTNGLGLGSIAGYRRIQYGSDNATSFTLLTDGNAYAGLYALSANFSSTIKTGNPTGSTSDNWLLGRALVSGSSTPDRWIRVQIGNLYYDILSRYIGSV
jgi:hypothetical protein